MARYKHILTSTVPRSSETPGSRFPPPISSPQFKTQSNPAPPSFAMLFSLILIPLHSLPAFASFNKARATGSYQCRIIGDAIVVNKELVPLEDYILELIVAYGKHSASAHAAFDAVRYAGLELPEHPGKEDISVPPNKGFSSVFNQSITAVERAAKVEGQLRRFDNALKDGGGMPKRGSMKKVVQLVLEEVEHVNARLVNQKEILRATRDYICRPGYEMSRRSCTGGR